MNYYAQGGQAHGLKSIAQEMQQMGRGGDTMLAHINPQEAALLKRLGGSGTINPVTGLPEFLKIGPVSIGGKGIIGVGKLSAGKILSKFDDVVLQPITGAIQDVVQDVAKATGPVGQAAAAYFGGPLGAAAYAGLSGEDGFNFKRGLMAGAMAYGAQNLAEGLSEAGGGAPPVPDPAAASTNLLSSAPQTYGLGSGAANFGIDPSAIGETGLNIGSAAGEATSGLGSIAPASAGSYAPPASFIDKIGTGVSNAIDTATNPSTYSNIGSNLADKTMAIPDKLSNMGSGISNLTSSDPAIRKAAMDAFKASGATMQNTALPMYMGYTGTVALDEMDKLKEEQDIENARIAAEQAEFDARINKGRESAIAAMQANPYMYAAGGDVPGFGIRALVNKPEQYGGETETYAAGGQPRYLSGGGDGMSDSIPATINGNQPARLADGEFVIPADVVSHLGNGSSKAGAKQLYSMMDKVRSARTGTKKQGRQINPNKFLPA